MWHSRRNADAARSPAERSRRLPVSELRLVSTGAVLGCAGIGNAVGGGGLAGVRNHAAAAGFGVGGADAVSAGAGVVSTGRAHGGHCGSPETAVVVLRRI